MALETLDGVTKLGGFDVLDMDKHGPISDWVKFDKEVKPKFPVAIHHDRNIISFTIQNGPVRESGVNGCQVDTLIHAAMAMLSGLNEKFPSPHNHEAIDHLGDALMSLKARTADREARGVEGHSER